MERARPPQNISPHDFFTRWVPDAIANDDERRRKLGDTRATIVFDLEGDEGGVFTLRLGAGNIQGFAGGTEVFDLRVRLDVTTWRKLNSGAVSAPQALLMRRIKLEGDFLLGLKLHLLLGS